MPIYLLFFILFFLIALLVYLIKSSIKKAKEFTPEIKEKIREITSMQSTESTGDERSPEYDALVKGIGEAAGESIFKLLRKGTRSTVRISAIFLSLIAIGIVIYFIVKTLFI